MLDCCTAIGIPGSGLQLAEVTEELDFGSVKLQLERCPSCAALWAVRSQGVGHSEWIRQLLRVASEQEFSIIAKTEEEAQKQRLLCSGRAVPIALKRMSLEEVTRVYALAQELLRSKE